MKWLQVHDEKTVAITNHVTEDTLEIELKVALPAPQSWNQFAQTCKQFLNLHFTEETFKPLKGTPFSPAAAKGLFELLEKLSHFKAEHDPERSAKGHELHQQFFTGQKAWYTDSSATEKVDFCNQMTFPHPDKPSETIFAPFHGKINTPKMRIHFSWPVSANEPLYILYIGDKITKR